MKLVLNEHTRTAHRPSTDGSSYLAACGALSAVSDDHVRTSAGDAGSHDEFDRCGRCFEDAGGY